MPNQFVSSTKTFTACGVLTLGPVFRVTASGGVTARAGHRVVLTSGFSAAQGATVDVQIGGPVQ